MSILQPEPDVLVSLPMRQRKNDILPGGGSREVHCRRDKAT